MDVTLKKILAIFLFSLPFFGCGKYFNQNGSLNTGGGGGTGNITFFASGDYSTVPSPLGGPSEVASVILTFHYNKVTNQFSLFSPTDVWSDPFEGNPVLMTQANASKMKAPSALVPNNGRFVRKVVCTDNAQTLCIAEGGFHNDDSDPNFGRLYGDYGSSISTISNGGSWNILDQPFENVNPNIPDPMHAHTSIEDISCFGMRCLVVGMGSTNAIRHSSDLPAIGYAANINAYRHFSLLTVPFTVGTTATPFPPGDVITFSNLNKVYCFDNPADPNHIYNPLCFILGQISSPLSQLTAQDGRSIILKSTDMINWDWVGNAFLPNFQSVFPPLASYASKLNGITCADLLHCFVVGQYTVQESSSMSMVYMSSQDGGNTWDETLDLDYLSLFGRLLRDYIFELDPSNGPAFAFGNSISCSNTGSGFCLAVGNYYPANEMPNPGDGRRLTGVLYRRDLTTGNPLTDHWSVSTPDLFANNLTAYSRIFFSSVICYNDKACLLSGEYALAGSSKQKFGFVMKTTDAGLTWDFIDVPTAIPDSISRSTISSVSY